MLLPADLRTASTDPFRPGNRRDADGGVPMAVAITPDDFCSWLANAMPGDAIFYYRGHLGRDRCRSTNAFSERDRQALAMLARQALLAAEAGRLHLLQRRHGDGDYSYIAIKARTLSATAERLIHEQKQHKCGLDRSTTQGAVLPSSRSRQRQSAREVA